MITAAYAYVVLKESQPVATQNFRRVLRSHLKAILCVANVMETISDCRIKHNTVVSKFWPMGQIFPHCFPPPGVLCLLFYGEWHYSHDYSPQVALPKLLPGPVTPAG